MNKNQQANIKQQKALKEKHKVMCMTKLKI